MKASTRISLKRGLAATAASVFSLLLVATSIAESNAGTINSQLGVSNYQVIQTGEAESDGVYYVSEFTDLETLINAKHELAEQISEEGSVLFKNINSTLPLSKGQETVTLWGLNSNNPTLGGLIGSSVSTVEGQPSYGIKEALAEKGFTLNTTMIDFYASDVCQPYYRAAMFFGQSVPGHSLVPNFAPTYSAPETYFVGELPPELYTQAVLDSAKGTTAVVLISRDSSEAADYSPNIKPFDTDSFTVPLALSDYERAAIELAKEYSNGKVIVLINSDMTMEIEELKQDDGIGAILWTGLPGINGFLGVADVLSGDANPSGHIADTYAVSSVSAPAMTNFGVYMYSNNSTTGAANALTGDNKADWYVVESEGIYVGYKYYETRYEDMIMGQGSANSNAGSIDGQAWDYAKEVSYPFGYGLSYTTFEVKLDSVDVNVGGTGTAKATVTNTGSVAGKCAVQLYMQAPYTAGGLEKAAVQLLDFGKTDILQPNQSVSLTIEFDPMYMASYDETVVKANGTQGAWVLEEGTYYFTTGNGAHEALNNILAHKLGSDAGLVTITPDETINGENVVEVTLSRDVETYSKNVQNALQDADINKLIPGTVEYTTRADWNKGWKTVESITPTEEMMVWLRNERTALTENAGDVKQCH